MSKGTPSFGKRNRKTHIICRRCGKHAYHPRKHSCASCGYGVAAKTAKTRKFHWAKVR